MTQDPKDHSSKPKPPNDMLDWMGLADTPNWRVARPLGIAFSLMIILFFVAALTATGAVLARTIFVSTGPNLGAGALIAAVLGSPFLIWGTVIKHRTWETQKEGHITDRISKAVEQLGAEKTVKKLNFQDETVETSEPNIEVRLGGLLSLERIAQDSTNYDKGRDHVRVMEILCAYVRENSNARTPRRSLRSQFEDSVTNDLGSPNLTIAEFMEMEGIPPHEDIEDHIGINAVKRWASTLLEPRADVQQALDILGRRDATKKVVELEIEAGYRLDLRGSNLQRADLSKGFWSGPEC